MTINDINITLKDGKKAVIRNACDEDIPGMLEYLYKSAGETDFILRYPEECSRYTPELEKEVFADMNASPNEAMLVCIVEGNSRARALYEKMGFKIVSMLPNAIRSKDGTLLNEYTMIRKIEKNW